MFCAFWFLSVLASARGAEQAVFAGKQPQLAADEHGDIHLVYGASSQIYHARSTDGGRTFSAPAAVGGVRFLAVGMRRGPRIAVTKEAIVVTAIGGEIGGGRDGDLFAWRSTDQGQTWSGPVRVNDVVASAREGLHAMSAGPDGLVYCAWLDLRNKRTEIMGASSNDGGTTWSDNRLVYRSPSGSVCECCHPSVAISPDGAVYVMFRNSLAGYRDMYVARSDDGGRSFDAAQQLGSGHWELDACPMDGGSLAFDASGRLITAWRRDKDVYTTAGKNNQETLVGNGMQPWLSNGKSGPGVVWLSGRPGELMLKLPHAEVKKLATAARDPVIVDVKNRLVMAWETEGPKGSQVTIKSIPLTI
jgi:hypothetical protein